MKEIEAVFNRANQPGMRLQKVSTVASGTIASTSALVQALGGSERVDWRRDYNEVRPHSRRFRSFFRLG